MTTTLLDPDKLSRAGTSDYDMLCASWNARVLHHPDAAFAPVNADEVAAAVGYAVANGMPIRVQATGHGANVACGGGMLINTSRMRGISVDPATSTASVQAGAKWIDVINAAYPNGLAPICGSSSDVGAVGFSLGGGVGWLARPYGLACDAIEAAQIVTADGHLRWVDATHEPDLFWALRGGGPNLGVVTELRLKLVPAAEVYGGSMVWPVERAGAVLPAWREWLRTLPTEMTSTVTVLHAPDAPFVPEPMRNKSFIAVMACYPGDPETGTSLMAPMHAVDGMIMEQIGPMPFTRIDQVSQDPVDPLPHALWSTMLHDLDEESIRDLVGITPRGVAPYTILEIRHVGGGVRPAPDRLGLAHWSGDFLVATISVTPTPDAWAAAQEMGQHFSGMLAHSSTGMAPLNFMDDPAHVAQAFTREHLERLVDIKSQYDPGGVFGGDRRLPV